MKRRNRGFNIFCNVTIAVLIILAFAVYAQAQQVAKLSPAEQIANIDSSINASAAQIQLITEQYQDLMKKFGALHRQIGINQRAKFEIQEKMKAPVAEKVE